MPGLEQRPARMQMGTPNPQELLRSDHSCLEALFGELLEDFADGHQGEIRSTWTEFERRLLAHFENEELFILPLFERVNPEEAAAVRAEHAWIRQLLSELGVGVDLHLVRLELARDFIGFLRAHAKREEVLMYSWAALTLDATARAAVAQGLHPSAPNQGEASPPAAGTDRPRFGEPPVARAGF